MQKNHVIIVIYRKKYLAPPKKIHFVKRSFQMPTYRLSIFCTMDSYGKLDHRRFAKPYILHFAKLQLSFQIYLSMSKTKL